MTTKRDLNREYVNYMSLEESGYRNAGRPEWKKTSSNLFQKTILSPNGQKMYFINVYEFDFQDVPKYTGPLLQYQAEVRFYRKDQQWDTDLIISNTTTIKEMEEFFMETFIAMNCDFDHHNN